MEKEEKINKSIMLDLENYILPGKNNRNRIFDAIPRIINETGFNIFDYEKVFADKATKKIMREGNTIGCFYIESPGMRSLLKRTGCDTFEMLTAVSSVIRPGVAQSGMMKEFIERHKNPARRKYLIPEMEEYLGETYGVMIYQEDVIKVASHVVGLSLEEADLLRRSMSGRMRSFEAMKLISDRFFYCCKEKKYSKEVSQNLWKQIESFAGFAFCKAHSASFALLSFQVAYLKAHYPAEFMAAVLTNQGGFYSAPVYIDEVKRLGLKILLPSINESVYEYEGNINEVRIGLMALLEFHDADKIVREREENGKYVSLADFLIRTKTGYERCEKLIKCGAMDCFNQTRPTMLRLLDVYFSHRKLLDESVNDLFINESFKLEKEVVTEKDFSIEEKCICEFEILGYMVSQHPLEFFVDKIDTKSLVPSSQMLNYDGRNIKMIGWYMSSKRIQTKTNEVMKILSLEDLSGTFEAVIFPKAYSKLAELTISLGPYLIEGKVDAENGNNIIVEKLEVLAAEKARSITQKERNGTDFFGDVEKPANYDEVLLVESLGKEKLTRAYLQK